MDSSIFNRIAGGNKTLRLDACFHLSLRRMRVRHSSRGLPVAGPPSQILFAALAARQIGRADGQPAVLLFLLRRQHHDHLAPFQLGKLLDDAVFGKIGFHPLEQIKTELLVRHFTATET